MPARLWAIIAVLCAVSLGVLDGVIVNIALPTISEELSVTPSESVWIVNAYQISIVVSLLLFAALGDYFGYRRIYFIGLVIFMVTSVGCAMSWSLESLVFFRVIQGIGASSVMSINTSIVRLVYPRRMLGRGLGINSTVVSVMATLGPSLAAAILAMANWQWLFLVNIPLGIASILIGYKYIPQNPVKHATVLFKGRDALLHILTFGLLFAVVTSISHGVDIKIVIPIGVVMLLIGYQYVRSQLGCPSPILPFDLLKIPIFSLSVATSILSFIAQMSTMVALPFFLQSGLGYSAVETGLLMGAWPALTMITAPTAGYLVEKIHAGVLGGIGLTCLMVGLFSLALITKETSKIDIIFRMGLCGFGFGLFQSPNNSVLMSSAPIYRSGSASGVMATSRLVGQTLGAALTAMLFYFIPEDSSGNILWVSGGCAAVAMILSLSRLSLPLPEMLRNTPHD